MVTFKYHSVSTAEQKAPSSFAQSHSLMAHQSHSNSLLIPTFHDLFLSLSLGLSKLLFYVLFLTTSLLISNIKLAVCIVMYFMFLSDFFREGTLLKLLLSLFHSQIIRSDLGSLSHLCIFTLPTVYVLQGSFSCVVSLSVFPFLFLYFNSSGDFLEKYMHKFIVQFNIRISK